ncbi:MAG: 3-dehydroquinate dehydratase [Ignavibacteriales bacterium]|nr:3-dehydroquinate dehydratase [Ignavibacteriales bacterium]
MKISVIHGANLNLLGERDNSNYGSLTLEQIEKILCGRYPEISFDFFQSNIEGEIVEKIQSLRNGGGHLIINPGGYAHTSIVIRDSLELFKNFKVEVHLSHLAKREDFRQSLITASACDGYLSGFKELGYIAAVELIKESLNKGIKND